MAFQIFLDFYDNFLYQFLVTLFKNKEYESKYFHIIGRLF